ncbi:peroxisomal membrane protein pex14 [Bulinus truncatus]|nr:peroxisomal membrane protein pex14 [Bulinus truncatus]
MDQDSGNSPLNGDSDKQILAPAEGPRENLINTAVKFLQNPKVMSSPLYQKKAFLEKKGLTAEEINIAVQRSGVKETENSLQTSGAGPPVNYESVNQQTSQTIVAIPPPQSALSRARDLTFTTVIVAGVTYAVYQIFQKYQQKQPQIGYGELKGISDLKADIASLKGLLLNRSQFPPAPTTSPVLPSWQRVQTQASPVQEIADERDEDIKIDENTSGTVQKQDENS